MNFKQMTFSALTALTLIGATHVQAETMEQGSQLNYNYVEGAYLYNRINGGESSDFGLDLQLRYLVSDPVFVIAGYQYTEFDFNNGESMDTGILSLGGGARFTLQSDLDAYVSATYDYYDFELSSWRFRTSGDADGFTLKTGVRYAVNASLELDGAILYKDIDFDGRQDDVSEAGLELNANYAINKDWSVIAGYEHIDDTNTFKLGARLAF